MDPKAGVSIRREKFWGLVGGLAGCLVGGGGFLVAALVDEAPMSSMMGSPLPPMVYERHGLALDHFWFLTALIGGAILLYGGFKVRLGPHPRSDGFGAMLVGGLLTLLPAILLYFRLRAVLG